MADSGMPDIATAGSGGFDISRLLPITVARVSAGPFDKVRAGDVRRIATAFAS